MSNPPSTLHSPAQPLPQEILPTPPEPLAALNPLPDHLSLDNALAASALRVLTPQQKEELLRESHTITLTKGQRIFDEGDTCEGFYLLLSGRVKIFHLTPDGKEMVLHLIRPGHSFGEAFVFRHGDYPMSAAAVGPGAAQFIPAALMRRLTRANADLAESMLNMLATRLHMFSRKLQSQGQREAPERLAAYLLHASRMRGGTSIVHLDMSREMLANMLGTARETISRILTRLAERGAISVHKRQVHILSVEILQRITDGQEEL